MAKVERGNVVLHVADDIVDHYISLGYNHVDEEGNIIKATLPRDVGALQKYYTEHLARISELEAEVARLTAELERGQKTSKKSAKATTEE